MTPPGFQPRAGQREILEYRGGRVGVAAVPGSGKTTTIAALAARLLAARACGEGPLAAGGQVLVVTYQNAAAEALRAHIGRHLAGQRLPAAGYDVRTLHSLAFGIVQTWPGHAGTSADVRVLDERSQRDLTDRAVAEWSAENPAVWGRLAPGERGDCDAAWGDRWRQIGASLARAVIAAAKNRRLDADGLLRAVGAVGTEGRGSKEPAQLFLEIGAQIYARYQQLVQTSGSIDFNDMVRLAVDLLEVHPDLAARLRARWPVVLEDEAQDSVPLQEELLGHLTSGSGHWIRVGDPNQAITSTFTAADPRFLRRVSRAPGRDRHRDVRVRPLRGSGCPAGQRPGCLGVRRLSRRRGARRRVFRRQRMVPTDGSDPQQNPPADDSRVVLRSCEHRLEELTNVARGGLRFAAARRELTLAALVPTNRLGYELADVLRAEGVPFDERLQSSASSRTVVDALARALAFVADPLSSRTLAGLYEATAGEGRGADEPLARLVRSCYRPESLLYPPPGVGLADAFPPVAALGSADLTPLARLSERGRRWLEAARFPVDQLTLAVAAELFADEDLARAHRVAHFLQRRADANPGWRLPELAAELKRPDAVREALGGEDDAGYEPEPGRLTLTTMHKAKGMEWDLVYLVGVDGVEFPGTPDDWFRGHQEHLGGDPAELARAQLGAVLGDATGPATSRAGQVEDIAERLRLLYVAITRARRYLSISFTPVVPAGQRTRRVAEALAFRQLGVLLAARRRRGDGEDA